MLVCDIHILKKEDITSYDLFNILPASECPGMHKVINLVNKVMSVFV